MNLLCRLNETIYLLIFDLLVDIMIYYVISNIEYQYFVSIIFFFQFSSSYRKHSSFVTLCMTRTDRIWQTAIMYLSPLNSFLVHIGVTTPSLLTSLTVSLTSNPTNKRYKLKPFRNYALCRHRKFYYETTESVM